MKLLSGENAILVLEHYMKLSPGELHEAVFWRVLF